MSQAILRRNRSGFGSAMALVVAAMLAAAPATSHASFDGAGEAPDYRFAPLSVYADFDGTGSGPHSSDTLPSSPSVFASFHDGNPDHQLYWDVEPGLMLADSPDGGFIITVDLPNFVDELPEKHLRVHIWWTGLADDLTFPEVAEVTGISDVDGSGAGTAQHAGSSPVQPFTQPDGGYQYHDWILFPNPDWESISISVPEGLEIDRIVVDTVSIPEPTTLGLLGAGAAVFLLRRRRAA